MVVGGYDTWAVLMFAKDKWMVASSHNTREDARKLARGLRKRMPHRRATCARVHITIEASGSIGQ